MIGILETVWNQVCKNEEHAKKVNKTSQKL